MDLSPASMLFGVVYGSLAVAMMQIGRRRSSPPLLVCGFGLLALTFAVGSTWWSWPLGGLIVFAGFRLGR